MDLPRSADAGPDCRPAAVEVVFERFEAVLARAGFLAMGGQIIDASVVALFLPVAR